MNLGNLSPPAPLESTHIVCDFTSGIPSLDEWLKKRALKNETSSASRTYVTCEGKNVIGYYCLSAGAVALQTAPKKITRNMPDPIPVLIMGRLAIDAAYQNQGIGKALLRDAIHRTIKAGEIAGIKALLVHALTENARRFYLSCGFLESPIQEMTLCLPLICVRGSLDKE